MNNTKDTMETIAQYINDNFDSSKFGTFDCQAGNMLGDCVHIDLTIETPENYPNGYFMNSTYVKSFVSTNNDDALYFEITTYSYKYDLAKKLRGKKSEVDPIKLAKYIVKQLEKLV